MKSKLHKMDIFYGWFIVAAGFVVMATTMGIFNNCASLFLKPVSMSLGFTRSEINITITIRSAVQMIISLFASKIFSAFNLKRLMQLSTITLFISYFAHSFAKSLIMFYILTVIASIAFMLLSILPLSFIISNWFYEKRGLAIGIAFMGSGIGGMIFNFLAGQWIVSYGWEFTYQILAFIMLLAIAPCTFFIIHIEPKDIGLTQLGKSTQTTIGYCGQELEGMMLSEASKTIQFWAISLCSLNIAMCTNTLMLSISPHLNDIGYSITFSANIVALSMGSLAIGKLILGHLFDRFGVRIATTISCIGTICGLSALVYAKFWISLIVIVMGVGIGCAFGTIANPIITHKIFGSKDYISIYGVFSAANYLGSMIGAILNGYFFDKTGSYITFFSTLVILCSITIIIYQFIFLESTENFQKAH